MLKYSAPSLTTPVFGVLLLVLWWGLLIYQDMASVKLREATQFLELKNYSRLLEAHTRSVIRGLDQVVTHLKAEYEEQVSTFDLAAQVARSPILKGLSVQVGVIDAQGFVRASTVPVPEGKKVDLSDREHFRVHVGADTGELFISKPVLGRVSGKWSIQLARRMNAKDGSFLGVMVVSLNPDYISGIYDQLDLANDSVITVVGRDGIVRARGAGKNREVGQSFADWPEFPTLWHTSEGSVVSSSPIDGVQRLITFRQLADYPLVVMVSTALTELTAAHEREHHMMLVLGLAGTVIIIGSALLLQWQVLRQHGTERKLRQRERELSGRNSDLEDFTNILAHHLQEPSRLQHAFCQRIASLLPPPLSPGVEQALQHVMQGALRQRALLRDVQLYMSVHKLSRPVKPCSAETALDMALDRLEGTIAGGGATVEHAPLPEVMIETQRLVDVFTALIENAIQYHRPNVPPLIRIDGRVDGNNAILSISDNGIGIPEEFRTRVFQVFERLNPRTGDPGTGIGLALAKKIIESAGGTIWIESPAAVGTTINFSIPYQGQR